MESGFRRRNLPRDYFTFSRYTFIPRFYSTGTPTQKLHSRNGKYPRSLWPDRFLKKEKLENGLGQIQWLRLWKKFAMTNHLVYQYTLPWIQESKINQFLYRTMFHLTSPDERTPVFTGIRSKYVLPHSGFISVLKSCLKSWSQSRIREKRFKCSNFINYSTTFGFGPSKYSLYQLNQIFFKIKRMRWNYGRKTQPGLVNHYPNPNHTNV